MRSTLVFLALCCLQTVAAVATTPSPIVLEGRLVDRDGAAVAGAHVGLRPAEAPFTRATRLLDGGRLAELTSTTSDLDGTYRLPVADTGVYELVVSAPGYLPLYWPVGPLVESRTMMDLPLTAGSTVKLDAELALAATDGVTVSFGLPRQEVHRGADLIELAVPKGAQARFHVGKPGAMPADCTVVAGRRCGLVRQLGRPVRLLVERAKKPLTGAIVTLAQSQWPLGRTAEDGSLLVNVPGAGRLELEILAADGGRTEMVLADPGESEQPPVRRIEVAPPGRLVVTVVASETKAPVAAALVATSEGAIGRTDKAGQVELAAVGGVVVFASARGRLDGLARDASGRTSLALAPAAGVVARVVDEAGKPRAGVRVVANGSADSRRWECWNSSVWGRTDSQGRALLRRLDATCDWKLTVRHPGLVAVEAQVPPFTGAAAPTVELVVPRGAVAQIVVTDEADTPVAGAVVTVVTAEAAGRRAGWAPTKQPEPSATTDADGVARVEGLALGSHRLGVRAQGFAPLFVPGVEVETLGQLVDFGTVVLVTEAFVTVEVVDMDGEPISGARGWASADHQELQRFAFSSEDLPEPMAVSGSDGILRIGTLSPASRPDVVVEADGFSRGSTAAIAGGDPVRIALTPAVRLAGRVVDEDGMPLAGAKVELTLTIQTGSMNMSRPARTITSADDGSFAFDSVAANRAYVTASLPGRQRAHREIPDLAAGPELLGIELRLLPGASVEGFVRGPDGSTPIDATVAEAGAPIGGGRGGRGASVQADGSYRIEGLAPGHTTLEATAEGFAPARRDLELAFGVNSADFTLTKGATLRGTVTGDGEPLVGAIVTLDERSFGFAEHATTNTSGHFELAGLPSGEHTLFAQARGWASGRSAPVEVAEGGEAEVAIALERGVRLSGAIRGLDLAALGRCRVIASLGQGARAAGVVDFEGRYVVEGLTPGTWRVAASVDGRSIRGDVVVTTVDATLDLEFPAGVVLAGRVLVDGEPGVGFQVSVGPRAGGVAVSATTDANGSFRLEGVAAGVSRLAASTLMNRTSPLTTEQTIEIGDQDLLDIELVVGTAAVAGRVVDLAGKAVAGAKVQVLSAGFGWAQPLTTDADGRFSARQLQAGVSTAAVEAKGYAAQRREVTLVVGETTELEIVLESAADFVFAAEGYFPQGHVRLVMVDLAGTALLVTQLPVGEQGRVRVESAPPGEFEFLVADATWMTRPAAVFRAVVPGEGPRVVLAGTRAVTVRLPGAKVDAKLVVRDGGGVVSRFLGWRQPVQGFVEVRGGLTNLDLPAGTWTLDAHSDDGMVWSGQVSVGTDPVEVVLTEQ